MRSLVYAVCGAFLLFLTSCFDIEEKIDIKSNGSGDLYTNMDMSRLVDMLQSMLGKEELEKEFSSKKIDTTIYLKDIVDTASDLTPEKKALLRPGTLRMRIDIDQKLFKANIHFPFTDPDNLQKLYTAMNDGTLSTSKLFKGLDNSPKPNDPAIDAPAPDMNQFGGIFDFQAKDGLISRKVNAERWKSLQSNPQLEQMKQASGMGVEVPYTFTVNLPRPAKKVSNPLAKLSEDKKTVTLKYDMTDLLQSPEKYEISITY